MSLRFADFTRLRNVLESNFTVHFISLSLIEKYYGVPLEITFFATKTDESFFSLFQYRRRREFQHREFRMGSQVRQTSHITLALQKLRCWTTC